MNTQTIENKDPKKLFIYCYSVAYRKSAYFRSHAFQVKEDEAFIKAAFEANDLSTLQFMEEFYKKLLKDQTCRKDISSKFSGSLVPLDQADKLFKQKKVKLDE